MSPCVHDSTSLLLILVLIFTPSEKWGSQSALPQSCWGFVGLPGWGRPPPHRPLIPGSGQLGSWDACVFHTGEKHVCLYHHISGEVCEVTLWGGAHAVCCARLLLLHCSKQTGIYCTFLFWIFFVLCNKCKDLVSFRTQVFQTLVEAEWGGRSWVKVSHCL